MGLNFARRHLVALGAAVALLGGAGVSTAFGASPPPPPPPGPNTLYVSATATGANTSCSAAGYATIQAAVNAAKSGATVYVCPGNYPEQVTISTSNLKLLGAGSTSIIDPTAGSPNATDLDSGQPTTAIVTVTAGTTGVNVSNLVVDGSGLTSTFTGCADNFVGVLYQAASGTVSFVTVQNIELPATLGGCQDGLGVFVQAGSSGKANVNVQNGTVNGYDKGGIVCVDTGTHCDVTQNTITGLGPTTSGASNGVQMGPGASGNVNQNVISGNNWTGTSTESEPQADAAAGVLVYGAGGNTQVQNDTLTDNQIAVEVVHSNAAVQQNTISESGSGIAGSIGVFAVPCDAYCSYFGLSGGHENDGISNNTISFPGGTSGADGVWVGDGAASPTGVVQSGVNGNMISGATNNVVFGPTAYGNVSTPPPPPGS